MRMQVVTCRDLPGGGSATKRLWPPSAAISWWQKFVPSDLAENPRKKQPFAEMHCSTGHTVLVSFGLGLLVVVALDLFR